MKNEVQATWAEPPLPKDWPTDTVHSFFHCHLNMLTMAPIAQPYSQDTCGIGSHAFATLGCAKSWFGIDQVEMKWSPPNCFHLYPFLSFRPPKSSLSLVNSSPNCQHKLIVALDGWHSACKPIAIRSLSFHCNRHHCIVVVPSSSLSSSMTALLS